MSNQSMSDVVLIMAVCCQVEFMSASHLLFVLLRSALVAISVRAGVDGAFGRVGLEWVTQLKTFTSLDGAVYLHHGQSLKVVLNTPEDVMDILTFRYEQYLCFFLIFLLCKFTLICHLVEIKTEMSGWYNFPDTIMKKRTH